MIDQGKFKDLGFSKNEMLVYISLYNLKKARASVIMKNTNLQRSAVYPTLDQLVKRKLVSKTLIRGVYTYTVNDPQSIVRENMDRLKQAQELSEELKKFSQLSPREASVYEGTDSIIKVSDQTLEVESGDTVYFLGPSKYGPQANLENYWSNYHKKRIAKGIKCKILYDKHTPNEIVEDRNSQPLCEAKYMPFGFDLPMWTTIYKDTVAMVVPGEEPLLAFVIRSNKTAQGFIEYFNYLWNNQPKKYFESI
jgi:sugar-specific transcriptional regulator TrmB